MLRRPSIKPSAVRLGASSTRCTSTQRAGDGFQRIIEACFFVGYACPSMRAYPLAIQKPVVGVPSPPALRIAPDTTPPFYAHRSPPIYPRQESRSSKKITTPSSYSHSCPSPHLPHRRELWELLRQRRQVLISCGINGILTLLRSPHRWRLLSAQRLAASMESSHNAGVPNLHGYITAAQRLAASMESS